MLKVLPDTLQSQPEISVLTQYVADSGIRMVHRESPDEILHSERKRYSQITTAANFADQLDAQFRREALGAWINFDTYRRRRNISGRYINHSQRLTERVVWLAEGLTVACHTVRGHRRSKGHDQGRRLPNVHVSG